MDFAFAARGVLLALALMLLACSGSPSEGTIRSQLVDRFTSNGGDELLKVEHFEKTDGFRKDERTYVADIRYDLVFKESLPEFVSNIEARAKRDPKASDREAAAAVIAMGIAMLAGDVRAGSRVPRQEKVTLTKTEYGWRLTDR